MAVDDGLFLYSYEYRMCSFLFVLHYWILLNGEKKENNYKKREREEKRRRDKHTYIQTFESERIYLTITERKQKEKERKILFLFSFVQE